MGGMKGDPTMLKLVELAKLARGAATYEEGLRAVYEAWQMGFREAAGIWEEQLRDGRVEVKG